MLKKRLATTNRHIEHYWKIFKFANLEDVQHIVFLLLLEYAFSTRNAQLAMLIRLISTTGRSLFEQKIDSVQAPDLGDAYNEKNITPVWQSRNERLCWCFARCHVCMTGDATERCDGLSWGKSNLKCFLVCNTCYETKECKTTTAIKLEDDKGRLLILSCNRSFQNRAQHAYKLLQTLRAVVFTVLATHTWSKKGKTVEVTLLQLTLARSNKQQLSFVVPLLSTHFQDVKDAATIVDKFAILMRCSCSLYGSNPAFRLIFETSHWASELELRESIAPRTAPPRWKAIASAAHFKKMRRQREEKEAPIRVQKLLPVTHNYQKPFYGAKLVACTGCKPFCRISARNSACTRKDLKRGREDSEVVQTSEEGMQRTEA
jgi:hypothetical protein